jgi:hypothetical protein
MRRLLVVTMMVGLILAALLQPTVTVFYNHTGLVSWVAISSDATYIVSASHAD